MTCARTISEGLNQPYDPKTDYYKRFREGVQEMHKNGLAKGELTKIIGEVPDNKRDNYGKMADAYRKFLGRKKITYFKPPRKIWQSGSIEVTINPEIGLEWSGTRHLIKLYLKADKPSKDRLGSILALMRKTFANDGYTYAVLDVRSGKLYTYQREMDYLLPLIEGEAQALIAILGTLR